MTMKATAHFHLCHRYEDLWAVCSEVVRRHNAVEEQRQVCSLRRFVEQEDAVVMALLARLGADVEEEKPKV